MWILFGTFFTSDNWRSTTTKPTIVTPTVRVRVSYMHMNKRPLEMQHAYYADIHELLHGVAKVAPHLQCLAFIYISQVSKVIEVCWNASKNRAKALYLHYSTVSLSKYKPGFGLDLSQRGRKIHSGSRDGSPFMKKIAFWFCLLKKCGRSACSFARKQSCTALAP